MNNNRKPPRGFRGRGPIEKPKDFKGAMKKLYSYVKEYMNMTIIAIILAILSAIFTIIGPDKIKELVNIITDGIVIGIDIKKVTNVVVFLGSLYLIGAISGYIQSYIMAVVTNRFSKKLRLQISRKSNKLPLKYFDKNSYGDILSRVTNDVDTICHTLNQSIANLVSSVVLFVGVVIMMFTTNYIMAITAILSTLLGFSLVTIILSKSQKYFEMQQNELGNINGHVEEVYSGHNVVKVYNAKDDALCKFDDINNKLYESARKSQFLSGLMPPIMHFIGNLGYVAICVVGAILVIEGHILIGTIVSFMLYTRLFTSPLSAIAQSITQLQSTLAASERVFEFLDEEEVSDEKDKKKKINKENVKGNIEFENVKFGYDSDKLVIKDFNAKVKHGEKIAIVGPTGAGKTTMVNLLMRFYELNSGSIKIDGTDIKDVKRENIHDLFCMVLQDTWIFEGTIKENVIYNRKNIKEEDVRRVCKIVGLDHFIKSLPDGYNTQLTDSEVLSQGEKQLLTIARAMLDDAPFLILDEATSSVDTRTEELVQKAMDKLTKGRTSFIIAHRLSTIKNADLILVMKDGNIVELGNHDELMNKDGFYKELYNSQFQN